VFQSGLGSLNVNRVTFDFFTVKAFRGREKQNAPMRSERFSLPGPDFYLGRATVRLGAPRCQAFAPQKTRIAATGAGIRAGVASRILKALSVRHGVVRGNDSRW